MYRTIAVGDKMITEPLVDPEKLLSLLESIVASNTAILAMNEKIVTQAIGKPVSEIWPASKSEEQAA